jgi:hypothetical protein
MNKILPIAIILISLFFMSCQKEIMQDEVLNTPYSLKITFNNKVGTEIMQLGNTYKNPFNETYTLTAFKYYISNIVLLETNGTPVPVSNVYHLVDEADAASKSFTLSLNKNRFLGLSFLIGVDSARNVSGTQAGDLDPAKGMFWTWNTGYIMAKMEANSPASPQPANKVEIHVGGFKNDENSLRLVSFDLDALSTIDIKPNGTSELVIEADANTWFNGVHQMKIADFPVSATPGTIAMKYADNYSTMFKVTAVNN